MRQPRIFRLFLIPALLLAPFAAVAQPAEPPAKTPAQSTNRLGPEDHFFDSDGVQIHYKVLGEGEPVLLIHGFSINMGFNWGAVMKPLAAKYKVIAIDNRGHGASGKPHDPNDYGIKMAEDQIRLLDHLNIKKAHIVGYSMGGFITMKLLATHPERFLSATLGGAGWMRETPEGNTFSEEVATSLEQGHGLGPLGDRVTSNAGTPSTPADVQRAKTMNAAVMAMNDPLALAACFRGMTGLWMTEPEVKSIKIPTLALIGEFDGMKQNVNALKDVMPSLEVVEIEKTNHMTAFTNPKFIDSLLSFLGKHGRAS